MDDSVKLATISSPNSTGLKSIKENVDHKVSMISHFFKVISDFLTKFCEFSKLELIMMGLEGTITVSFHGEFMSQKFHEGFSCKILDNKKEMSKRLKELKAQLIRDSGKLVGKERTKKLVSIGSNLESKLEYIKDASEQEVVSVLEQHVKMQLLSKPDQLQLPPLPPGRERAKRNFFRFTRLLVLHLDHVRLRAVKREYEKYDHAHHHNTIDDFFAAIPKSLGDFEGLMMKYVHKMMSKAKHGFRNLLETIIRRAGHIFDDDMREKVSELFSSLCQKMDIEVNIYGYLKAGVEIHVDLDASKLIDRFTVLEGRDNGIKIYSEWANKIVLEHVKILHEIHIAQIKERNLGSMRFGWVKKQDRKKSHIFRRLKRWPLRYLILSSAIKSNNNNQIINTTTSPTSPTSSGKVILKNNNKNNEDQEYYYKLEYFRHATDKEIHSTPIVLTDKMWCFPDSTYENSFKVKVDKNGVGYKEGDDGLTINWETIFSAICVDSTDEEYIEAIGAVNEEQDAARDKWVEKINEAINLIQGKIDEEKEDQQLS